VGGNTKRFLKGPKNKTKHRDSSLRREGEIGSSYLKREERSGKTAGWEQVVPHSFGKKKGASRFSRNDTIKDKRESGNRRRVRTDISKSDTDIRRRNNKKKNTMRRCKR